MNKVFMITQQFPPIGGSGVQRTSKFVKYLPEMGYEPIVFTVNPKKALVDPSLSEDIGKTVRVIRTKPYEVEGSMGVIGKLLAKLMIPDAHYLWHLMTRKQAYKIVLKDEIRLIYSSSYPYSGHLTALYIKKKLPQVKWVADFRDEWTNNPYILDKNYNHIRKRIEKAMERQVALSCDRFIANTPLMLKAFALDNPIEAKSDVIPNGFDQADFDGFNREKPVNDRMIITHSGSMYGRTRPDAFFEALTMGIKKGAIDQEKILIRIVGSYTKKLMDRITALCPYEGVVEFIPYVPHKESIKKLLESDALLFVIGIGQGSEKIYTGKIFEYFYANRPIIGMVPPGSVTEEIIKRTAAGIICSNEDPEDIYPKLIALYKEWEQGELKHQPDWEIINSFDRRSLTKRLTEVFQKAMED